MKTLISPIATKRDSTVQYASNVGTFALVNSIHGVSDLELTITVL